MVDSSAEHPYYVLWRIDLYLCSSYLAKVSTRFPSPFARGRKTSLSRGDELDWLSEPRVVSCRKNSPILSTVF